MAAYPDCGGPFKQAGVKPCGAVGGVSAIEELLMPLIWIAIIALMMSK